ncbi:MAG TPA: O-antigen ligase family protein [Actinomycetota bacterium]|nr:O-antigen ligase family protein [Actinomycetota bacterium]
MRRGDARDPLKRLAAARRAVLLALVFGVPVFILWGVALDAFLLPKVALLAVTVALAASLKAVEVVLGGAWRGLRAAALPVAFVAFPAAVAWAASDYRRWALLGEESRLEGLVPVLLVAAAGLLLTDAFRGDYRAPAWTFVASATIVALYELVQSVGLDPLDIPIAQYAPSTIGQSNFVGGFLAAALPLALAAWTSASGAARAAAMGATVVLVLGILLAFSQGGWAAAAAGVSVFAGRRLRDRHRRAPLAGVVVAAAVAGLSVGVVLFSLVDPSHPAVPDTARSRGLWWRSAIQMAAESPVWGHGPNVYAIEGPHDRTATDALSHDTLVEDAPHSVPLSLLANHGLLGLAGFAGVFVWAARRVARAAPSPVTDGLAAGAAAYFAQSLVSVDSPVLQLALWVCIAGIAASTERAAAEERNGPRAAAPARLAAGAAIVLVLPAGAGWWSFGVLKDDAMVLEAMEESSFGRHAEASGTLEKVLDHRSWEPYRRTFGLILGRATLDAGADGEDELARMKRAYAYLDDFPNVQAIAEYAGFLHQWSIYDVAEEEAALAQLFRQLDLDPYNPTARILASEALLRLGRASEAVDVLEFLLPEIEEGYAVSARVWGALAVAYYLDGRIGEARSAVDSALASDGGKPPAKDCHVLVARELLRRSGDGATRDEYLESSPDLFVCAAATLALLPGYDPQDEER